MLIALVLTVATARAERVDYFATDFSGGMPEGTLTLDRDGQTLHFTMIQAGFEQGDAWRVFTLDGTSYAASPARHKTAKGETVVAADDWMVLPAVRIMAADATMTWKAMTKAESIEEGCSYEVRISTEGPEPEHFTAAAALSVEEENMDHWQTRSISLGDYAGREVWIAFVHTSLNREILAVENISISGSPGLYRLADTTPRYTFGDTSQAVSATVEATSATPVTAFTAYCEINGETLSSRYDGTPITVGSPAATISFALPHRLTPGQTATYSVRIVVDGNEGVEQPAVEGCTTHMLFEPRHRVVAEEGTGMWCGYCPRGIVAMREMREKYPDTFIGIAVHYDDVLGVDVQEYCAALQFPSFPSAYVNRTTLCGDPLPTGADGRFSLADGLERPYLEALATAAPADLDLKWRILDNGRLGLVADAHFAINAHSSDYRLTAIAIEDEVSRSSYYQTNYYSGSAVPLGGFETEEKKIMPYTFEEVARAALLPFEGTAGEIPAQVCADTHYKTHKEVAAPRYDNLSNVRVVLMLLDAHTGTVVNAVAAPAASAQDYDAALTGIATPITPAQTATATFGIDGRRLPASSKGLSIEDGKKHIR